MRNLKSNHAIVSGKFTMLFALGVMVIGLLVVIGWFSGWMFLTRFSINEVPMAPSTAYVFILMAAGLWFYLRSKKTSLNHNIAIVLVIIAICLSGLLGITNIFKYYTNWEHPLFRIPKTQLSMQLGHMSLVTAILFIISGFAVLFLQSNRKIAKTFSIILTLIIFTISFILLLAYGFGTPFFYFDSFIPPAVLTVLSFLLFSLALIAASDKNTFLVKLLWEKSISAKLLRIFLPTTIAITIIESLIIIRILPILNIHAAIGVSSVSLIVVAIVTVVISIISKSMGKPLDFTLENLSESETRFRIFMNAHTDLTFIKDDNFRYLFANEQTARLFNRKAEELIGKTDEELAERTQIFPCQSSDKRALESNEEFTIEEQLGDRIFEVTKLPLQLPNNKKGIGGIMKDITERKIHEEELQESEKKYRDLISLAQEGIWVIDKDSVTTFSNPSMAAMLGYFPDEMIGKSLFDFMDEAGVKLANKNIEYRKAGFKAQHDFEFICKNGDRIFCTMTTAPIMGKTGNYEGAIAGVIDVSERKREEKILDAELKLFEYAINHSEEELLQKFLDEAEKLTDSEIGFYHYIEDDQESISLQTWSSNTLNSMCKGLGESTRHYPISKAGVWIDCIKERKPVIHNDYSSLAHKKGLPEGHAPIIRELVVPVIRGKQIMAVFGVGNKKSDYKEADVKCIQRLADAAWETVVRKQAEKNTRIAEENLKNTFDLSPSIIAKANMNEGRFMQVNKAITKILGYSIDEFTSRPYMEFVHPDDRQSTIDIATEQLKGNDVTFFENRYLCKDGSYKWMAWHGTKPDDDGGVTTIGSDINERKHAELKLNQSNQLLETSQSIAKLGGWELDIVTNNLYWTAETYRIHDTSPDEFNPTVDAGVEYFLPESRLKISKALEAAIKDGEGYDFELETYTTKGRRIDIRTTCEVTLLDGQPIKLIGIFQDITEQKKAKEELKISEEKFRLLYHNSPDMHASVSPDNSMVLFCNDTLLKNTNYSKEEVIGASIFNIYHEDSLEDVKDAFQKFLKTGEVNNRELILKRKDGSKIDVSLKVFAVRDETGKILHSMSSWRDITERKQAEEKIRITEQNLKNTFDISPSIICKANVDTGYFIEVNQAITRLLGYSSEEFVSRPSLEYIHLDDRQRTLDEISEQLKGKDTTFFENRYLCKDGSYKWMAWNATKADENGIVTAIASDINERKIIEQEIVETKQFYENIIEGVQDGIWVTDKNDVIFYANSAMEKIAGVPREQIQGNNVLKDFPEETIAEFYKQAKKEKKPVWYEIEAKTPAGKETCQNGWLIPQYQNKAFEGIICTVRDISKRKKAEGSVRKLSTAVQQSPSSIVIADTEGRLEYVNPKFTELTGYSSSESIGQESNILKSGEQDSQFYKAIWKTLGSGKVWRGQFHNKKKNGELFWEAASISAILNESGNIINYIKIGEDITLQKNIEEELKIALEKALESDRLKSAFLANMSHEIRTPMNGVLGFVNLLTEPNLSKSEIDEYSDIINRSGNRLMTTINDIIDISKIEAGQMVVSTTETSIGSVMDELYSFHSSEANLKGLSLILEPSLNDNVNIITDDYKLHGILTNLIKNAIKYTEKGYVTFGYCLKEDFIEFFVKDTGIGIPKDRIHAIFNRFEQADIEDSRVLEGSGLGLAISKAYAEMLGGEISATSDEGNGTTFTFTIPHLKKVKKETKKKC